MKYIITALFCFSTLISFSQEEKYYQITNVHREDNEGFRGFTLMKMQEYLDSYYHFIKKGNVLYFDLPEKKTIAEKDLVSLNDDKYEGKFLHQIYEKKVVGNKYIIKFIDNATLSDSKKTVIEFTEITKDLYFKNIEEEIAFKKKVASEITSYKENLEKNPIRLESPKVLDKEIQIVEDYKGSEITFSLPKEYVLRETGNIKNKAFGDDFKIGNLKENSVVYEIESPNVDYGLNSLTIYMMTDKNKKFNLVDFLKYKSTYAIIKQDENSFVACNITYDFDNEKAIIGSYETLKYYYYKGIHIFIASSISLQDRFVNGVKQPKEDILSILKHNFELQSNINLKF